MSPRRKHSPILTLSRSVNLMVSLSQTTDAPDIRNAHNTSQLLTGLSHWPSVDNLDGDVCQCRRESRYLSSEYAAYKRTCPVTCCQRWSHSIVRLWPLTALSRAGPAACQPLLSSTHHSSDVGHSSSLLLSNNTKMLHCQLHSRHSSSRLQSTPAAR